MNLCAVQGAVATVVFPGKIGSGPANSLNGADQHGHDQGRSAGLKAQLLLCHVVAHERSWPVGQRLPVNDYCASDHGVFAKLLCYPADLLGWQPADLSSPLRRAAGHVLLE